MSFESQIKGFRNDFFIENTVFSNENNLIKFDSKFSNLFSDENDYMVNTKPHWLPNDDAFQSKMRNFVDHVLYNKETVAPGEHGLIVQKMLDGIYNSAEKGREVVIK